jgi:hypothetical protein
MLHVTALADIMKEAGLDDEQGLVQSISTLLFANDV